MLGNVMVKKILSAKYDVTATLFLMVILLMSVLAGIQCARCNDAGGVRLWGVLTSFALGAMVIGAKESWKKIRGGE